MMYSFGALAALALLGALALKTRRGSLGCAAVSFGAAATAAHYDSFWSLVSLALLGVWSLVVATSILKFEWRMRAGLVLSVAMLSAVALWPTVSKLTHGKLPLPAYFADRIGSELVAGLDLAGGLRLTYSVDVEEAIRDRRDRRYDDMQAELTRVFGLFDGDGRPPEDALKKVKTMVDVRAPREDSSRIVVDVKEGSDPSKIDERLLSKFRGDMNLSRSSDKKHLEFTIKESVSSQIRETAVQQAKEIILRRVDELGLREAGVSTRDEDIIVEVAGKASGDEDAAKEQARFDEIREIISQTARLEFKLLDDELDVLGQFANVQTELPEGISIQVESVSLGADSNGDPVRGTAKYAEIAKDNKETLNESLERFKAWTSTIEIPDDRVFGYQIIYKTEGDLFDDNFKEEAVGWRTVLLRRRAEVVGDQVRDASSMPNTDPNSMGGWFVSINFTDAGGRAFAKVTEANVKRRFAIVLDERVESTPVINEKIGGGSARITMGSSDPQRQLEDAKKLELVLRSGALPAPITPSNETLIGPSLGDDAVKLGARGGLVGGLLVLGFMIIYYGKAGLIADTAVALNLFLQMAILAGFGASMTLPGIAGLALTVGMSVDSNVLINERIREELAAGKTPLSAIELGYARAVSAIIDGHLTTLISAVVLAQFGSGPIKGFAITLLVGVICSIFTGVVVSRLLFDFWVRRLPRGATINLG